MNPARLVHPGFWFGKSRIEEAEKLASEGVGGFCVFGGTPDEIEKFSARMRSLSPYPGFLISADYEEGLGRQVHGAPLLPNNMAVGAGASEEIALKKGLITARQARSIGVDWVLGPKVDLACDDARSYGLSPQLVSKMAASFMIGMSQGGALNCVKFFPGRGADKTVEELFETDLLPYRNLLKTADSIMAGLHKMPLLDSENIAALSPKIVRDLLLKRFNYKGCVVTDLLCNLALPDAAERAFYVGADILLAPARPLETIEKLKEIAAAGGVWRDEITNSVSSQEIMISKIARAEIRNKEQAFQKDTFCAAAALRCITEIGDSVRFKKGQKVHCVDLDKNTLFAQRLADAGVNLTEYHGGEVETLLTVSYKHLNATHKKHMESAFKHAGKSVFVSFAPQCFPDGFEGKVTYSLLAYTEQEDFQEACARSLMGDVKLQGTQRAEIA